MIKGVNVEVDRNSGPILCIHFCLANDTWRRNGFQESLSQHRILASLLALYHSGPYASHIANGEYRFKER